MMQAFLLFKVLLVDMEYKGNYSMLENCVQFNNERF